MPASSSRVPTEQHLYSKKYYKTRVKNAVEAEIGDRDIEPSQRINIVARITAETYKNESEEIKQEIRQMQEEERVARESAKELDELVVEGNQSSTPEAYMLYVNTFRISNQDSCGFF